jgi:hypothetical protein
MMMGFDSKELRILKKFSLGFSTGLFICLLSDLLFSNSTLIQTSPSLLTYFTCALVSAGIFTVTFGWDKWWIKKSNSELRVMLKWLSIPQLIFSILLMVSLFPIVNIGELYYFLMVTSIVWLISLNAIYKRTQSSNRQSNY